jgi:branched-chain amino acid transport system substrate-binding protein
MKRKLLAAAALATCALAGTAQAQVSDGIVKIGVLNDMSGPYADIGGPGSVVAAKMAVEDYIKATKSTLKVEIVSADHQNKPDVGSNIARQWYDTDKVDMITDVPTSSVGLAIAQITKDKNKAHVNTGSATADLSGKACNANVVHWLYDTWMLANGTGKAIVKNGGTSWYFLTADYAFGHALERDTEAVVLKNGGKVVGKVRTPFPTQDFSSFLLQAQASKAKIIGLANASRRIWHRQGRPEPGRHAGVPARRACTGSGQSPGPALDRDFLLGSERPDPRLVQTLCSPAWRQDAFV